MWQDRLRYGEDYKPQPFNSDTYDSQAQRDRARIIHSSSFRRLQSKTQVLGIGESDFYRTRLTHSLEVAQIGSGICEQLKEKYKSSSAYLKWIPTMSQIEAICLAHDIGHPPFGHGGEIALNFYMYDCGGFEGNGQTLRIVSKLGEYSPSQGLDLTRRTMLGLLKYPVLYKEVSDNEGLNRNEANVLNIDKFKPPKCIHDDELDILTWVMQGVPEYERLKFRKKVKKDIGYESIYKAFDTSIMELADDISYGVHDLEDALALQLVTYKQWNEEVIGIIGKNNIISKDIGFYNTKLFSESNKDRKHAISKLVGYFVSNIRIENNNEFETPLLGFQAIMSQDAKALLKTLKDFVLMNVIRRPEVQTLEYKGQQMILKLFEVLQENPKRLLPASTYSKYQASENKKRVICDYISGMTDSYATKLYHKLFSPDMGSIFDRM